MGAQVSGQTKRWMAGWTFSAFYQMELEFSKVCFEERLP